ncbi:MAG: aldose epimerase [Opitutus sp.]
MEKISYLGETIMRWSVGPSTFLALPQKGARLMNWNVTHADGTIRDIVYWPELSTLDDFYRIRGGNPILFPFSARTFDRGEIGFWRAADGVRRPMPQHGIARQSEFKIVRLDARGFAAQLVPDAEARAAYPYDYEFTVTYRFESLSLSCEFALTNHGPEPLPWCAGHHFYFTLPWTENSVRADYHIHLPATERLKQDSVGQLVPGPTLNVNENVGNVALIDTLHTRLTANEVKLSAPARRETLSVKLGTAPIPPADATFVTWSADEKAAYYCVEPWMGPPNAPEHKRGLELVRPRETRTFSVTVAVS